MRSEQLGGGGKGRTECADIHTRLRGRDRKLSSFLHSHTHARIPIYTDCKEQYKTAPLPFFGCAALGLSYPRAVKTNQESLIHKALRPSDQVKGWGLTEGVNLRWPILETAMKSKERFSEKGMYIGRGTTDAFLRKLIQPSYRTGACKNRRIHPSHRLSSTEWRVPFPSGRGHHLQDRRALHTAVTPLFTLYWRDQSYSPAFSPRYKVRCGCRLAEDRVGRWGRKAARVVRPEKACGEG